MSSLGSCEIRPAAEKRRPAAAAANRAAKIKAAQSWSSDGHYVDSLASDNSSSTLERPTAAGKLKKYESTNKINSGMSFN